MRIWGTCLYTCLWSCTAQYRATYTTVTTTRGIKGDSAVIETGDTKFVAAMGPRDCVARPGSIRERTKHDENNACCGKFDGITHCNLRC